MLEIGRLQQLTIARIDDRGAWLQAGDASVLLPLRELPAGSAPGQTLEVLVYHDGSGVPVATLRQPKGQVGEFALLKVSQSTKHGAFLDWGLEKDVLCPFSEQPERMRPGRSYLVKLCLDSQGRVVATAQIERCLEPPAGELAEGDAVQLQLWEFTDLGAKVIINQRFGGLLYQDELPSGLRRGSRLSGYIKRLREDGKIDVCLRQGGAAGAAESAGVLLAALRSHGFLPLHDQSSPEQIQQLLGLSKKAFKKALGGLYKAGLVELEADGVRLKGK